MTECIDTRDIVDVSSVEQLQGLASRHSTVDTDCIADMMSTKKFFSKVNSEGDRAAILARLLSVQNMIPSLYTFFKNLKYLEPCAEVLRGLLPPGTRKSVSRRVDGLALWARKDTRWPCKQRPACSLCRGLWVSFCTCMSTTLAVRLTELSTYDQFHHEEGTWQV